MYREVTSRVPMIVLGFSGSRFSIHFTKSVVSLMKDFDLVVTGFRKISTKKIFQQISYTIVGCL